MKELTHKKILGFKDGTQTFTINAKQSDTSRKVVIQIVDNLTLVDMTNIKFAHLYYKMYDSGEEKFIDVSSTINTSDSTVTLSLSDLIDVEGLVFCEIVFKDKEEKTILTTNTFFVKVKVLGGDCNK